MTTPRSYLSPFGAPMLLIAAVLVTASVMLAALVVLGPPARAETTDTLTVVTNTNDSGAGSLRQAMIDADATSGEETIQFAPSLSGQTITLASALPTVTAAGGELIIDGGSENVTISGKDQYRVFYVGDGAKLYLDSLTVADGGGNKAGGAIYNGRGSTLWVNNSTIKNSTIAENSTHCEGGAIYNYYGTVTVDSSTISGNSCTPGGPTQGGGISNAGGTLTVLNSTIAENSTTDYGGGIYNYAFGTLKVVNSTIAENRASTGGGIYGESGTAELWNTIVADNHVSSGESDCAGSITDKGNNLESGTSCGFSWYFHSSLYDTDPFLGDLADNGGPTETMALLPGSKAINAGNNDFAKDLEGVPLAYDQRGVGYQRVAGDTVDIGAFEYQGVVVGGPGPPPAEEPEDKQACKKGGYEEFGFKNQGQCIKAVNANTR